MQRSISLLYKTVATLFIGIALGCLSIPVQAAAYSVWYNAEVLSQASGGSQDRIFSFSGCNYPTCSTAQYLTQTSIIAPAYSAASAGTMYGYGSTPLTQQSTATWDGTASMGYLSGSSVSTASISPATYVYNNITYNNTNSATGISRAPTTGGLGWSDTATITSDTLSFGAGVDLLFTLRLDSLIDLAGADIACADTGNRAFADSRFTLGSPGSILLSMKHDTCAYGWSNSTSTLLTTGLGSVSDEISRIYHTTVGAALPIGGWLSTYSSVSATAAKSDMAASANANSYFYVDIITPGASYVTASGTSYLSSVPLPGTAWLLATGLAGLIGISRRKTSKKHPVALHHS